MVRPRYLLFGAIFGLVVGLLVLSAASTERPGPAGLAEPPPGLAWAETPHHAGTFWQTERIQTELQLTNSGSETVEDVHLIGTCRCTAMEPALVTLPPHSTRRVVATVDLTGGLLGGIPWPSQAAQYAEVAERIEAHGEDAEGHLWRLPTYLVARFRRSFRVTPRTVLFGTIFRPATAFAQVKVECMAPEPVTALQILSHPDMTDVAVEPSGIPGAFQLSVRTHPQIPLGRMEERVKFRSATASGPFKSWFVSVVAHVEDDLHALPQRLVLGVCRVGEERGESLIIQSHSGDRFRVERAAASGPVLRVVGDGSDYARTHAYTVYCTPEQEGYFADSVRFGLRTHSGRQVTVEVPLSCWARPVPESAL